MQNKVKILLVSIILILSWSFSGTLYALPKNYNPKGKTDELQSGEPKRVQQVYDVRKNTVSNIQFYTSNYGIFGQDVARNTGGGFWPRGSLNQYIFAGGIWFGAQKMHPDATGNLLPKKYVAITYDPNNGISWMVPGRIIDYNGNEQYLADENDVWLYRTYMSSEFSKGSGKPLKAEEKYSWPIWDIESKEQGYYLGYDRYFGRFINNPADRNLEKYPKGPAYITEEDIFASFKDTDLNKYQIGSSKARQDGYPLKLQFEQMIYSWGFGEYKDFIFIKYDIINMSKDSLRECWMAPIMDVDIARAPYTREGADNDNVAYYKPKEWEDQADKKSAQDTLNLAYQWTKNTRGEDGKGFGYLGYDFLESPAVFKSRGTTEVEENGVMVTKNWMWRKYYDVKKGQKNPINGQIVDKDTIIGIEKLIYDKKLEGFVRKDKRYYETIEQLGLVSFRNWNIDEDKLTPDEKYNFLSEIGPNGYYREGPERGPGDKRFMMATGPFHMAPKDTVRIVVGIILALPSVKREADGSNEDVANLVKRDMFAQAVYDNNFRAPRPPENTFFLGYKSYNNAIEVYWDSTAEMSMDLEEKGLDFMGYTLSRARDPYLDTFNVNKIAADDKYSKGRGPFGWKALRTWSLNSTPFVKIQDAKVGEPNSNKPYPMIDDFEIVGIGFENDGKMDTMSISVVRKPTGFIMKSDEERTAINETKPYVTPSFYGFGPDTNNPWTNYFRKFWTENLKDVQLDPLKPYQQQYDTLFINKFMTGRIKFNEALMNYNPLYYIEQTIPAMGWKRVTYSVKDTIVKAPGDTSFVTRDTFRIESVAITPELMNNAAEVKDLVSQYRFKDSEGYYIYLYNTLRPIEINGDTKYYLTRMKPLWSTDPQSWANIFKNADWLAYVKKQVVGLIQKGFVNNITYNDAEMDFTSRKMVIEPYMKKITNGRKFYDFGDDDNNGIIETSDNSALTERILNNIGYYYKLEAFDEGDYLQPTESKKNDGSIGRPNNILTYAKAGRPDDYSEFEITRVDGDIMGGLRNFKFFGLDPDRVNQKLAGKTLILQINPYTNISSVSVSGKDKTKITKNISFYASELKVIDSLTKETLFRTIIDYSDNQFSSYMNLLTENGFSIMMADTLVDSVSGKVYDYGLERSTAKFTKRGSFSSGHFNRALNPYSYSFTNGYENLFGFSFDYGFEQQGGVIRSFSIEPKVNNPNISTTATIFDKASQSLSYTPSNPYEKWDYAGAQITDFVYAGDMVALEKEYLPIKVGVAKKYNIGPADYLITFKEGGTEQISVTYNNRNEQNKIAVDFTVPYLTYDIKNTYGVAIEYPNGVDTVKYGFNYDPMELPETATWESFASPNETGKLLKMNITSYFPHPRNLKEDAEKFTAKYNTFAVGFVNSRNKKFTTGSFKDAMAVGKDKTFNSDNANVIGKQNRYYKSATNAGATIDFVNMINIGGAVFVLDYAQMGSYFSNNAIWEVAEDPSVKVYNEDFKAGDQLVAKVRGGAFGMPLPGAEVHARVKAVPADSLSSYTSSQLSRVKIVPNPYYISHEAQKSAYDTKIFFTKLPRECNIDIYTINGDLVKSLKHVETSKNEYDEYTYAMEPWDLYSSNNQRVQSQTFIALITAPNGEKSTVKFSVVVGSTRLIAD